jgi:hypothetical protein
MTVDEFTAALRTLVPDDLHRIARSLADGTTGDEVDAWRATIAIDRALRHTHRAREAGRVAWRAAQAVQNAAAAGGIRLPDPDVTHVARAAAEIARGLVAGADVHDDVLRLLQHWIPLVAGV